MDQFIESLSEKLGIAGSEVRSGASVMLGLLKEKLAAPDFEKLVAAIPGARELVEALPATPAQEEGGLLGGLLGAAGGLLGGQAAELAKIVPKFQAAGIPMEKIPQLAQAFGEYVRTACGPEMVEKLAAGFPALKAFLKTP